MKRSQTYTVEAPMRFIFHVTAQDADAAEKLLRDKLGQDWPLTVGEPYVDHPKIVLAEIG
jgi:hypothetical protein